MVRGKVEGQGMRITGCGVRYAVCELLDSAYRVPDLGYRCQTAEKSVSAKPAPRSIHCSVMAKPAWRPRSSIWVGSYLYELSVQIRSPCPKETVASAASIRTVCV